MQASLRASPTSPAQAPTKAPDARRSPGASVQFIGGEDHALVGLYVTVPASNAELVELYSALRRSNIQVTHVQLTKSPDTVCYVLNLREFDGSRICRERWVSVQAAVLQYALSQPMQEAEPDVEPVQESGWRWTAADPGPSRQRMPSTY